MKKFLSKPQTRERYGNRSEMSLYRWQKERGFPTPYKFNNQCYYLIEELDEWDARNFTKEPGQGAPESSPPWIRSRNNGA